MTAITARELLDKIALIPETERVALLRLTDDYEISFFYLDRNGGQVEADENNFLMPNGKYVNVIVEKPGHAYAHSIVTTHRLTDAGDLHVTEQRSLKKWGELFALMLIDDGRKEVAIAYGGAIFPPASSPPAPQEEVEPATNRSGYFPLPLPASRTRERALAL